MIKRFHIPLRSKFVGFAFAALAYTLSLQVSASPLTTNYSAVTINFAAGNPTTSGLHDLQDHYTIGGNIWKADLSPFNPTYLRSPTQNFADVLSAAFPGFTYASAANELSDNSLVVRTYDVQGTPARVGAEFHIEYAPHGSDPTTNLHWIQVVTNNHNITDNPGHGNTDNTVDNPFSPGDRSPYYDDGGAATSGSATGQTIAFYDFPGRTDADMSHYWSAELFLVTGPMIGATSGQITTLGGVQWGWKNVPEPATIVLMLVGLLILSILTRHGRTIRT